MDMELETTLLVDCNHGETVMKDLAARKAFGTYDIVESVTILMQDRYFDTENRSLSKNNAALRIRKTGRQCLVCVKGKEHIHEWGGIERLEIEHPWSLEALEKIIPHLGESWRKPDNKVFCMDDPDKTISRMGLKCIQDRQTNRIILGISHRHDPSESICAEMALDRVAYTNAGTSFLHYEIEIEAKASDGDIHLKALAGLLKKEFPDTLKRWDHNKLITGFAIETLLEQGELGGDTSGLQFLRRIDYEKIETVIIQMNRQLRPAPA